MKKMEAMINIAISTTQKQLRRLIQMVHNYRNMLPQRSHLLETSSSLTSAKWTWKYEFQTDFESMNNLISKQTLQAYHNFIKPLRYIRIQEKSN
jgi:hypothetical protein